jgi:alpha-glucosidase (family GH31 glycosyl hydrolase)
MGRNNYLGSPVDIHRYNDFNYNQPQDRGPINGLAYAYSGFANVYPDIVGGTGLATGRFGEEPRDQLAIYLMRYAEYAALNPSMSFGYGPWNFDDRVVEVTRQAAMLHDRLQPYIYSNAVKAYETGFPYPMTPLPLAYPEDEAVYGLADTTRRSYQWLIGESLMATPLYGDDYATAESRDVYLPEGTWMEYDSGAVHEGPTTLEDYPLPVGKTPLFVGGSGVVVEEVDGELKGRLYPVADEAETVFYDRSGEAQSTITVAGPDWEAPTVIDQTTGEEVTGSWNRHAYEFSLTPGHNYTVE